jgi:hypothetical protein
MELETENILHITKMGKLKKNENGKMVKKTENGFIITKTEKRKRSEYIMNELKIESGEITINMMKFFLMKQLFRMIK